ncbi:Serine/threonine-protein kinase DCLK1 [Nymphon striatum]|nr:Serine/threonine-protein kinase DCLK1 [Nymphon striatum]
MQLNCWITHLCSWLSSKSEHLITVSGVEDLILINDMATIASPCTTNSYNDHFSTISRGSSEVTDSSSITGQRRYSKSRNGRCSPSHSAHGCLMRTSLRKLCQEKRARKVQFFINADRFFKGIQFAVSSERFRSFESLLEELTRLLADHQADLPTGVRIIYNTNGTKVSCVDEILEGHSYICASSEPFKNLDYSRNENRTWCVTRKYSSTNSQSLPSSCSTPSRSSESSPYSTPSVSMDSPICANRDFIRPRLVTIIRNGIRPRKAVRMLLNKKTAQTFDQVLSDVTDSIKLDTGAVRKVFTLGGKQVVCLEDFFKDALVFIAYGQERYSHDDFDLDTDECRYLSNNMTPFASRKERFISLQSPLARRRVLSAKNDGDCKVSKSSFRSIPRSALKHQARSSTILMQFNASQNENNQYTVVPKYPFQVTDEYEIGQIIGDGNFAVVHECCDRKTKKEYALKVIDKTKCRGKEHLITSEVILMRNLNHPNIVAMIHEFDFETELYLVLGLVKGGDLFDAIASVYKFTEKEARELVYDLSQAIYYLHSLNIVHRDIKPENLLVDYNVDGNKVLKLADFGLAIEAKDTLYTVCGTPTYVAPEILAETGYGLGVDVWAAGVITFILLCGFPPFSSKENRQDDLFDKILMGEFEFTLPYWENISDLAKSLIRGMLTVDRFSRLSSSQVVQHPWVVVSTKLLSVIVTDINFE